MRRCRQCREYNIPKTAPKGQFCCGVECAMVYARTKTQRLRTAKVRRERSELRAKTKTLSEWVRDAQKWVNKVVVLEDKPKGCISCDSPNVTEAGHYFHRGSKYRLARLTLNRFNLNGQCGHCNRWAGGGNQHDYRLGFIARYGEQAFDELCELKRLTDCGEIPPLTIEDCVEIIREAKAKIKLIEK